MARPANADAARTRERLLTAAADQFSRHGVQAASLREVARSAGVTLATIHHYFGNKHELYAACLDAAYARVESELRPMVELMRSVERDIARAAASDEGVTGSVAEIVQGAFRLSRRHRATVQLIMRPVLERGELDARWRDESLLPFLDQTSRRLASVLGRPVESVRLDLQSLVSLVMRYSLSTPAELARVAGLPPNTPEAESVAAVERYLVDLTLRMALPARARA